MQTWKLKKRNTKESANRPNRWKTGLIGALLIMATVVSAVYDFPMIWNDGASFVQAKTGWNAPKLTEQPYRLGLDLQGGTHLVYEADMAQIPDADRKTALEGVRDVIEKRVNAFGVSEPVVQVSGSDRLIVELAGISEVSQAIQMIGETPFLEFKEETAQTREIFDAQTRGERLGEDPFTPTGLNGRHLKRSQLVFDQQTGVPQVSLLLNDEGAKLFAEITKRNVGKIVAIYLDGVPISLPVVQTRSLTAVLS